MATLDAQQILETVARKSAGETDPGRGSPPTPQALQAAIDALTNLQQVAQVQALPRAMQTQLVAVTRASSVNTDRAVANFLDANPSIAQRSVPSSTVRNLDDLDSGLSSVGYAAQLASAGFLQVVIDEKSVIQPAYNLIAELAQRTDYSALLVPGVTVIEAQMLLADPIAKYKMAVAEQIRQQKRKQRQEVQAAAQLAAAQQATQDQQKVAKLRNAAKSGQVVPSATPAKKATQKKTTKGSNA